MTLRLVIEHAAHPQRLMEWRLDQGRISIGRAADCDWQLDDPDMFVSRRHCTVTGENGRYSVTDESRGGLFVDGSDRPLGTGVTIPLGNGSRLRLGDILIRAELLAEATPPQRVAALPAGFDADDFFAAPVRSAPPPPPRPETLPQPFERDRAPFSDTTPERAPPPPLFDDPFTLDPVATPPTREASAFSDFNFDDFATASATRARERTPPPIAEERPLATAGGLPPDPVAAPQTPLPEPIVAAAPLPLLAPVQTPAQPPAPDLAAAFFRGLGLDLSTLPGKGTPEEMEALGKSFRLMAEGLVHLLRTRAAEKNSVRVAQTVIGSAEVNPLKFLAATEEALAALVTPRGRGYLAPDQAITAAFRDLGDHQLRTWTALQSSLRRMIDRFDPAAFEAEIEKGGLIQALISGGRAARLWQLYTDRYRDMAKSAEDRFLGEIGADFRDAYENRRDGT